MSIDQGNSKHWRFTFGLPTLFAVITAAAVTFALLRTPQPKAWEYHSEYSNRVDANVLSDLGAQGWELVAVMKMDEYSAVYYFKRPKR